MTPSYYAITLRGQTYDLYDLFLARFGEEMLQAHLQMTSIEYLWRAGDKQSWDEDMYKAHGVLQRAIDEPATEAQLPLRVVELWCHANGYGLVRTNGPEASPPLPAAMLFATPMTLDGNPSVSTPPCPPRTPPSPAEIERDLAIEDHLAARSQPMPAPLGGDATVYAAACHYWTQRHGHAPTGKDIETLKERLHSAGWPLGLHYFAHREKLHAELPALFPAIMELPA